MFYNIIKVLSLIYFGDYMKNKLINTLTIITMAAILFVGYTAFSLRHTEKTMLHTGTYSEKQINSAMNTVARHFTLRYPDCKLTRLYTNANSFKADDTIIILADYDVGQLDGLHPSMNTGSTYTRWQFHLTKRFGLWFVTNQGYG